MNASTQDQAKRHKRTNSMQNENGRKISWEKRKWLAKLTPSHQIISNEAKNFTSFAIMCCSLSVKLFFSVALAIAWLLVYEREKSVQRNGVDFTRVPRQIWVWKNLWSLHKGNLLKMPHKLSCSGVCWSRQVSASGKCPRHVFSLSLLPPQDTGPIPLQKINFSFRTDVYRKHCSFVVYSLD